MKIKALIAAAAALLISATSCGLLGGNSQNASTSGTSVGSALLGLYTQYKTDGKIDLSNITNIVNLATVVNNIGGLKKGAVEDSANSFIEQFTSGLVTGSNNLVNQANSVNVLGQLKNLTNIDLSAITNAASQAANGAKADLTTASQEVSTAVNSVTNILKMLGK